PFLRGLVLRQSLREQDEGAERDGAERVRSRHRRLDPARTRWWRREGTTHDRELALRPHLVCAPVGANEDAEPVVVSVVVDDTRQLAPVEPGHGADRRLDLDPRQLVLEYERRVLAAGRNQLSRFGLAGRAERVQVAHVRLVLEDEQFRDLLGVDRRYLLDEGTAAPAGEAVELGEHAVDDAAPPERERVDGRTADA